MGIKLGAACIPSRHASDRASIGILLSKQQSTKALIRLHGCAGWSAPLWFAYGINRFSHDVAHFIVHVRKFSKYSGRAGWSAPFLFACGINRFSHDVAHFMVHVRKFSKYSGSAGWSAPLLFAYGINRFSHDVAHFMVHVRKFSKYSGSAGWSAPLLFAYGINRFSHDVAHFMVHVRKFSKYCTFFWIVDGNFLTPEHQSKYRTSFVVNYCQLKQLLYFSEKFWLPWKHKWIWE